MYGRVMLVGVLLIVATYGSAVVIDQVMLPSARHDYYDACFPIENRTYDEATCARFSDTFDSLFTVMWQLIVAGGFAGLTVILGFFMLDEPLPKRLRPRVTQSRIESLGLAGSDGALLLGVRVAAFAITLEAVAAVSQNLVVLAVVLAPFAAILFILRRRLTAGLLNACFVCFWVFSTFLVGYLVGGLVGIGEAMMLNLAGYAAVIALSIRVPVE